MHRRQSNPDSRADIVRCVEYKSPSQSGRSRVQGPVCDLIPLRVARQYRAGDTVCLELNTRHESPPAPARPSLPVAVNVDPPFPPKGRVDTAQETCTICAKSNPDLSKITSPPIKSCLKKNSRGFTSSTSMPSIDTITKNTDKSDIEHVNRKWRKAYDNPQTDKVLHKISHDLDLLLNRTQSNNTSPRIEKPPT